MKKLKLMLLSTIVGLAFIFNGCQDDARIASQNLSKAANTDAIKDALTPDSDIKQVK